MTMNNVSKIWWLHPVWIYFIWILFSIYCSTIDSRSFYEMYEEPIYISVFNVALYITFFMAFALGFFSYTSRGKTYNSILKYPIAKIKKIFLLLYVWVVCAYIIWFVNLYITYGNSIILGLLNNLAGYANMFKDGGAGFQELLHLQSWLLSLLLSTLICGVSIKRKCIVICILRYFS